MATRKSARSRVSRPARSDITRPSPNALVSTVDQCLAVVAELERQLEQAYALVSSAKGQLEDERDLCGIVLLDMAEDILGDRKYINLLANLLAPRTGGAA